MPDWQPIWSAPLDREIEVSVRDQEGYHMFVFPVRRTSAGWISSEVKGLIPINPTHWRESIRSNPVTG